MRIEFDLTYKHYDFELEDAVVDFLIEFDRERRRYEKTKLLLDFKITEKLLDELLRLGILETLSCREGKRIAFSGLIQSFVISSIRKERGIFRKDVEKEEIKQSVEKIKKNVEESLKLIPKKEYFAFSYELIYLRHIKETLTEALYSIKNLKENINN